MPLPTPLPLQIARIEELPDGTRSFERAAAGVHAGSHVSVQVPSGLLRKYSLCNNPRERHSYVIAVKREANGRGGTASLVDRRKVCALLPSAQPQNVFPQAERAKADLFIAGGSMIRSWWEPR